MRVDRLEDEDGNHPRLTENRMISKSASQKIGMDIPIIPKNITTLSKIEYWRTAATIPIGIPISIAMTIEMAASFSVRPMLVTS